MAEAPLALRGIHFNYGEAAILRDVSYAFAPGRLTAICGPNGSGKSTALGIAAGQLRPKSGAALLHGAPVGGMSPKARAQVMAMLPQSPDAPAEMLVRDLVALGRYARRKPLAGLTEADEAAIRAGLEATHMGDLAHRPLAALSGGQRQRAWIAMILAQEAPLILMDEPTNHLDIAHAAETLDLLKALVAERGKTVIVILHDINLMASHADDVVLMKDGAIFRAGSFEQTVDESAMSALYERPFRFGSVPGRARPFLVVV